MIALRRALGAPVGLPATAWMVKIGAFLLGTDAELILKSRRAVPRRLRDAGFTFHFPTWLAAAAALAPRLSDRAPRHGPPAPLHAAA
jgi:NAD dependent epimerase/dehydratase family enzyme